MSNVADPKEFISYDPETGNFRWLNNPNPRGGGKAKVGGAAGCLDTYGYTRIKLHGRLYFGQYLAWWFVTGEWPKKPLCIDHINRVRSDNRFSNLRLCTPAQNSCNRNKSKKTRASTFKGTRRTPRGRWVAVIRSGAESRYLGTFADEEEAARAYDRAAVTIFGAFAALNFPEEISP